MIQDNAHINEAPQTESSVALECVDAWKVFGPDVNRVFNTIAAEQMSPDDTSGALRAKGCIVAMQNINLTIQKGEIFVIMGLSGSGKSTLVRCMTGLSDLTHGQVLIDGTDISHLSQKELIKLRRRKISMVFQDFALLPHLTTLNNIAFPLRVQGMAKKERTEIARKMIDLVGLSGRESYYPDELSGGQQQRVGIARSLTTQPEVWFLDEPFSALDPLIRYEMQEEILRLQTLLHKSIIFITHDIQEAVKLADRMAVMKDGHVVQVGRPEDFILNPADSYIEAFIKNIPKDKVLKVSSIMDAAPSDTIGQAQKPISASARLSEVVEQVIYHDRPTSVTDGDGNIVGSLKRETLLPFLI